MVAAPPRTVFLSYAHGDAGAAPRSSVRNETSRACRWCKVVLGVAGIFIVAGLSGCVSVPLPAEGPKPVAVNFPEAGETRADASRKMGITPVFDGGRFQIYEWASDRSFVMAVAPMGVPVAAVVKRNACRLLVEFDAGNRVVRIDFSDRSRAEGSAHPTSFELLRGLRQGVALERARVLNKITGLEKARFNHVEVGGAPTEMRLSSGGEHLLAVDRDAQGWMIDLRKDAVVGRFRGVKQGFWSLKPPGFVRMAMGIDERGLVLTQYREGTRILGEPMPKSPDFVEREHAPLPGFLDVAVLPERGTMLGLETDAVVEFDIDGRTVSRAPIEGLLAFNERGPGLIKPVAAQGFLMAARLQVPSVVNPDVSILFSRDGKGLAILDSRNDYARASAHRNYRLSPDGSLLIVNKVTHVEVWDCVQLVAWMTENRSAGTVPAPKQVFLMPFTNKDDSWKRAHVPVAMSDDGRLLAAAGVCSVSVWDLETGETVGVAGPVPLSFSTYLWGITEEIDDSAMSVQAISVSPEGVLTTVFVDYRNEITIASWKLSR